MPYLERSVAAFIVFISSGPGGEIELAAGPYGAMMVPAQGVQF